MSEEAVAVGEVIVEATRDLVQLDVAGSENYVSEQEYRATPFANCVEDVLGLQAGGWGNAIEGEIKIREGTADELRKGPRASADVPPQSRTRVAAHQPPKNALWNVIYAALIKRFNEVAATGVYDSQSVFSDYPGYASIMLQQFIQSDPRVNDVLETRLCPARFRKQHQRESA